MHLIGRVDPEPGGCPEHRVSSGSCTLLRRVQQQMQSDHVIVTTLSRQLGHILPPEPLWITG